MASLILYKDYALNYVPLIFSLNYLLNLYIIFHLSNFSKRTHTTYIPFLTAYIISFTLKAPNIYEFYKARRSRDF